MTASDGATSVGEKIGWRAAFVAAAVSCGTAAPAAPALPGGADAVQGCAAPRAPDYDISGQLIVHGQPQYGAGTCGCLAQRLGWHLEPDLWNGVCVFQAPPLSFDPSRAMSPALRAWGIPESDAPDLKNFAQRETYFSSVRHEAAGERCGNAGCRPVVTSVATTLDGPLCSPPPNPFLRYCIIAPGGSARIPSDDDGEN